jgi:hypothetical protein
LGVIAALKDISNLRVVTLALLFILFAILGKREKCSIDVEINLFIV